MSNKINPEMGDYYKKMIEETGMTPKSIEADIGHWTRVKRLDESERSVIDYIIMTDQVAQKTQYLEIDETGTHRLKGKSETDHNTIITQIDIGYKEKVTKETIYNTKNRKNWKDFDKELHQRYENKEPKTYEQFEEMIKEIMEEKLEKITITRGQYKPKLTERAKRLKEEKKEARKAFENATKMKKRIN